MKKTIKLFILALTICSSTSITFAQERAVTVTTKTNANKSVDFTADKTDPGTYTVIITFKNLSNTNQASQQSFKVSGYGHNFLTLSPTNKDQGIGYSYSYTSIRGKLKPKIDPEFVYILPYQKETIVRAAESGFANTQFFGSTTPEDWKAYRFYTDREDTVVASRKGVVVEVKDIYDTDPQEGVSYTSKVNSLIIEHADGTLASYKGFKKGTIGVKLGQTVFPGTALGVNTKSNNSNLYNISLMIMYLKSDDIESTRNKNMQASKSLYGFATVKFYTKENPSLLVLPQQKYTAGATTEIIQREMTKKEIKQLIK